MTDVNATLPKPVSQRRAIWQQFRTHKGALFGLITLGVLILAVLIGPYLWIPEKLSVAEAIKLKNQGPSFRFPFGTDQLGRDMLARMLLAGRVSLAVGLVAIHTLRNEQVAGELAAVDTALLVDDLPPAAYADPGFARFVELRRKQAQ